MFILHNASCLREGKVIQKNITLPDLDRGDILVIQGQNGVGKSTLLQAIMGISGVELQADIAQLNKTNITSLTSAERIALGLVGTYQNPPEIEGVTIAQLVKAMFPDKPLADLLQTLKTGLKKLDLPQDFVSRFVHAGLSGGQKKLLELLLVWMMKPTLLLLDEVDSGLDVDKQHAVAKLIEEIKNEGTMIIVVSHSSSFIQLLSASYTYTLSHE